MSSIDAKMDTVAMSEENGLVYKTVVHYRPNGDKETSVYLIPKTPIPVNEKLQWIFAFSDGGSDGGDGNFLLKETIVRYTLDLKSGVRLYEMEWDPYVSEHLGIIKDYEWTRDGHVRKETIMRIINGKKQWTTKCYTLKGEVWFETMDEGGAYIEYKNTKTGEKVSL